MIRPESSDPYTWPASMRQSLDAAMSKSAPDVETVASVLAGHQMVSTVTDACTCGAGDIDTLKPTGVAIRRHWTHLAAALEPLIREREAKALDDAADAVNLALANEVGGHTSTYSVRRWLRSLAATHREARP